MDAPPKCGQLTKKGKPCRNLAGQCPQHSNCWDLDLAGKAPAAGDAHDMSASVLTSVRALENAAEPQAMLNQLQALGMYVLHSEAARGEVVTQGGVAAILETLDSKTTGKSVHVYVCGLLCNLASEPKGRKEIKHQDGLHSVLLSMSRFPNNREMQSLACATLWNLSADPEFDEGLTRVEVVEAVFKAMSTHIDDDDETLQLRALSYLCNLCAGSHAGRIH